METQFNQTTAETYHSALRFAQSHWLRNSSNPNVKAQSELIYKNTDSGIALTNPYKPAQFFLSEDSLTGFAVREDGELCGVFSIVKGRGASLMRVALHRGATSLNCFEGFLSAFYARHGFIEVGSERNYGGDHLPRVVYMALKGEACAQLGTDTAGRAFVA